MRVKKPVLLIALALVLLAVALILPATAFGAGKQPVAWVTYASGVRTPVHEFVTATVKQLSDGTTVGRMQFKLFYEAAVMTSTTFLDDYGGQPFTKDLYESWIYIGRAWRHHGALEEVTPTLWQAWGRCSTVRRGSFGASVLV
jgi:hypothetical protein